MRKHERTHKLAQVLMNHPDITQHIFKWGAEGSSPEEIVKTVHEKYGKVGGKLLSVHYVRQIYHRRRPFNQPAMFSTVDEAHAAAVASRFRGNVQKTQNGTLLAEELTIDSTITVLTAVLRTRVAYHKAMQAALDLGLEEVSVNTWCDVVEQGDLNDHS
jgi:hypothetical protein